MVESLQHPANLIVAPRLLSLPDSVMIGSRPPDGPYRVLARLLGAVINTREVVQDNTLKQFSAAAGLTFVFRYGVAVTFSENPLDPEFDAALLAHVLEPAVEQESESASLVVQPGVDDRTAPDGQIILSDASDERLLLVATVLARSVVLARDEILVSAAFDGIDPLVSELREHGRVSIPIRNVMKLAGDVLAARHRVMGAVQVSERPDLLWDHPDLDRLYTRMETEYELREREEVLERKYGALGDFTEVLLDIVQDKRSFRLEAAIIALIAFEIVLSLINMMTR
jgi:uncharacterized Rmd1/YagE family protein